MSTCPLSTIAIDLLMKDTYFSYIIKTQLLFPLSIFNMIKTVSEKLMVVEVKELLYRLHVFIVINFKIVSAAV